MFATLVVTDGQTDRLLEFPTCIIHYSLDELLITPGPKRDHAFFTQAERTHKSTDKPTDRPTDRPTDQQTDPPIEIRGLIPKVML